jgi:DNA-binding transcriptional ArsR family regulator
VKLAPELAQRSGVYLEKADSVRNLSHSPPKNAAAPLPRNQKVSLYLQPKGYIIMRRDVFQAIADPTRREILGMIAAEPLNVNTVAENFDVSRTAIYKHIKILIECGLVDMKQKGRERFCEAKLEKLGEVSEWVEQYRKMWTAKLDSLRPTSTNCRRLK